MIFFGHQVFSLVALCPIIAIVAILTKIRRRSANLKRKSSLLQYELGPAKKKARLDHLLKREDLISQLPDDVLVSILSWMSTKDAARTSLLSRRWRNLHRLLPVYNIELNCIYLLKHVLVDFGIRTDISSQRWRSLYRCLSKLELWFGYLLAQQNPHRSELVINSLDRF